MSDTPPAPSVLDYRLRSLEATLEKMQRDAEQRQRDADAYRIAGEDRERAARSTFFWQSIIGPLIVALAAIAGTHFIK